MPLEITTVLEFLKKNKKTAFILKEDIGEKYLTGETLLKYIGETKVKDKLLVHYKGWATGIMSKYLYFINSDGQIVKSHIKINSSFIIER
jgi:hypothetical protein